MSGKALTIPTKFTAVDKFSSPVQRMGTNISKFAAKTEVALARSQRAFRGLIAPIGRVNAMLGGFGLAIGGALLFAAVSNTIGIFKDFEQANADLAAVMRTASAPQLKELQNNALVLGATTAKTATQIVGLQESLGRLGFETPAVLQMTQGIIAGSNAMRAELSETAELTGAVINTFDQFSAISTPDIMDKMVAATQRSALTFEKLQTALPIVGGAANAIGVPFEKTLALLGKLSDAGLDASMSSTALRNIFIKSKEAGQDYQDIIKNVGGSQDALTASVQAFGVRAGVPAVVLSKKLEDLDVLFNSLKGNVKGLAVESARIRLDTLTGAITLLNSAYSGFVLSIDNGTGAFSNFLKTSTRVVTDVFALAGGFAAAESSLSPMQKTIRRTAENVIVLIKVIGGLAGLMLAWKLGMVATTLVLGAYSIAIGVMGAVTGVASIAISGNTLALGAYSVAIKAATIANYLFAASNPVGWLLLAGAAISGIVMSWDTWGKKIVSVMNLFLPFIVPAIELVSDLVNNWDKVTNAFKVFSEAFKNSALFKGIQTLGESLVKVILFPLRLIMETVNKLFGTDLSITGASLFADYEEGLARLGNLNGGGGSSSVPAINPEANRQEFIQRTISEQKQNTTVTLVGNGQAVSVDSDNDITPIRTEGVLDWGY